MDNSVKEIANFLLKERKCLTIVLPILICCSAHHCCCNNVLEIEFALYDIKCSCPVAMRYT